MAAGAGQAGADGSPKGQSPVGRPGKVPWEAPKPGGPDLRRLFGNTAALPITLDVTGFDGTGT